MLHHLSKKTNSEQKNHPCKGGFYRLDGSFFNVVDHFFTNHRVGVNLSVTNLIK